jgi:hypothetical protein
LAGTQTQYSCTWSTENFDFDVVLARAQLRERLIDRLINGRSGYFN